MGSTVHRGNGSSAAGGAGPSEFAGSGSPRKLRSRHVTMITLGGIIGASLFV